MSYKLNIPLALSRLVVATTCYTLLLIALQTSAFAQPTLVADQLQSLRPNLFIAEELNSRGRDATAEAEIRPCDEVWLVSSRWIEDCTEDPSHLSAMQLLGQCWHDLSVHDLKDSHESNPAIQTLVYVHGNMTDLNWSIVRALQVYKNLIGDHDQIPPIRFVIWSWPSERQTIPIRDALMKSRRAVREGITLRSFLDHLDGTRPRLLGYSFGAQVVISALQAATCCSSKEPFLASVIAPAFDRDFIHCQIDACRMRSSTLQLQAFVNENDRVIRANNHLCKKKYRRSCICDHLVSSKLNGCGEFLEEIDITSSCQFKHSIILYSQQPAIVACVQDQLVPKTLDSSATPSE